MNRWNRCDSERSGASVINIRMYHLAFVCAICRFAATTATIAWNIISLQHFGTTSGIDDCNYRSLHAPSTRASTSISGNRLNGTGNCVPLTSRFNCAKCQMDPLNHFVGRFVRGACAANRMHRFAERRQSDKIWKKEKIVKLCDRQSIWIVNQTCAQPHATHSKQTYHFALARPSTSLTSSGCCRLPHSPRTKAEPNIELAN